MILVTQNKPNFSELGPTYAIKLFKGLLIIIIWLSVRYYLVVVRDLNSD